MKKFLLSAFVVLAFAFYSIHKHIETGDAAAAALAPHLADSTSLQSPPATPAGASPDNSNTGSTSVNISQVSATPVPTATPTPHPNSPYRDGQYTGDSVDAYYGYIQVQVTISGGKISDLAFLDYPHDRRTSVEINSQALPYLKQEAIAAQSANVDIISGATDSSRAFIQSLQSALNKAKS